MNLNTLLQTVQYIKDKNLIFYITFHKMILK